MPKNFRMYLLLVDWTSDTRQYQYVVTLESKQCGPSTEGCEAAVRRGIIYREVRRIDDEKKT